MRDRSCADSVSVGALAKGRWIRAESCSTRRRQCECGGRVACAARARGAKRWYRMRRGHDLCRRCYRAEVDRRWAMQARVDGRPERWPVAS
jgi:hypothetical protein